MKIKRSLFNEAHALKHQLRRLQAKGSKILAGNPSMESAELFVELTNAYIGSVKHTVSIESNSSPEEQIHAAMEGIGQVIDKVIKFFSSVKKSDDKKQEAKASIDDAETQKKNLLLIADPAFRKEHGVQNDFVVVPGYCSGYFILGGKVITDPVIEFQKQLDEYRSLINKIKGPAEKYIKWAGDTWNAVEKVYETLGKEADDYSPMLSKIEECAKHRPPFPTEIVDVPVKDRLGFDGDDWFVEKDPRYFEISTKPDTATEQKVAPLQDKDADKALKLISDYFDLYLETYDIGSVGAVSGGFDDYPYRLDQIQDMLWNEKRDPKLFMYDWESVYQLADPWGDLADRLADMEKALYTWAKRSYGL